MMASFVDLRKKSAQVIQALKRQESVTVFYRGKPAAIMHPIGEAPDHSLARAMDHSAFGLWA